MREFTDFLKSRQKVNLTMVIVNIVVFIVLECMGSTENANFMIAHGAAYTPLVQQGQVWRLFTAMFLHFGFRHLACNMFSLLFLGDLVERSLGAVRYLIIYLGGGFCGSLLSYALSVRNGTFQVSAGASGAIFACMGAFIFLALMNRKHLGPDGIRRIGIMILIVIMQSLVDKGVDSAAHFGGMAAGFLLTFLLVLPVIKRRRAVRDHNNTNSRRKQK